MGSTLSYDCATKKMSVDTGIKKQLDEHVTVQGKLNEIGESDIAFKSKINENLAASFWLGGNISSVFHGKTHHDYYSGVSFKFSI